MEEEGKEWNRVVEEGKELSGSGIWYSAVIHRWSDDVRTHDKTTNTKQERRQRRAESELAFQKSSLFVCLSICLSLTPFSSGLGKDTVGNAASGSCCEGTGSSGG